LHAQMIHMMRRIVVLTFVVLPFKKFNIRDSRHYVTFKKRKTFVVPHQSTLYIYAKLPW
jgi:hypothetical protein